MRTSVFVQGEPEPVFLEIEEDEFEKIDFSNQLFFRVLKDVIITSFLFKDCSVKMFYFELGKDKTYFIFYNFRIVSGASGGLRVRYI